MERKRSDCDDHHLFYLGRYWEAYKPGAFVRKSVIARGMARAAHNLLHIECSPVPPLSYESLSGIARCMDGHYSNVFEGIEDFSFAVDKVNRHPRIKMGEIMVNELAVMALRDQIPYIRDGLPSTNLYIVK